MADPRQVPSFACDEITGWSLTEFVAWQPAELGPAIAELSGMQAPPIGTVTRQGSTSLIRIAPDRLWLLEDGDLHRSFAPAPAGIGVLPLKEGRSRFRLSGARCRTVLAKCVAIDWEEATAASGRAVQTMLHRVQVLILRSAGDEFDVFVPRSFGRSVHEWIHDAAREFIPR